MKYYPEAHSHIIGKVKVVLDLTSYPTKQQLDHVKSVDKSDLADKKYFIALTIKRLGRINLSPPVAFPKVCLLKRG